MLQQDPLGMGKRERERERERERINSEYSSVRSAASPGRGGRAGCVP